MGSIIVGRRGGEDAQSVTSGESAHGTCLADEENSCYTGKERRSLANRCGPKSNGKVAVGVSNTLIRSPPTLS